MIKRNLYAPINFNYICGRPYITSRAEERGACDFVMKSNQQSPIKKKFRKKNDESLVVSLMTCVRILEIITKFCGFMF